MVNLFAYGGLMLPANLQLLTGNQYQSARARLRGFARLRVGRECKPGLKRESGALTCGRVYYGLARCDLDAVTQFLSPEFETIEVRLVTLDSQITPALTHVPRDYQAGQWSYEPWSYERLCRVYTQADAAPFGLLATDSLNEPIYVS